jgi:uncharacterized repeat protein (TIGR03803 family)
VRKGPADFLQAFYRHWHDESEWPLSAFPEGSKKRKRHHEASREASRAYGGASDGGTIFRMTPNGAVTILHEFATIERPGGARIQATDGDFYGTTTFGGATGSGTIFRMTPGGMSPCCM